MLNHLAHRTLLHWLITSPHYRHIKTLGMWYKFIRYRTHCSIVNIQLEFVFFKITIVALYQPPVYHEGRGHPLHHMDKYLEVSGVQLEQNQGFYGRRQLDPYLGTLTSLAGGLQSSPTACTEQQIRRQQYCWPQQPAYLPVPSASQSTASQTYGCFSLLFSLLPRFQKPTDLFRWLWRTNICSQSG